VQSLEGLRFLLLLTYALLKYQLFVISAELSATLQSLQVDLTERSGQESEELGDTDSVDSSNSVDVVVVPGVVVVEVEVLLSFLTALLEVSADDLNGGALGTVLGEVERTGWRWVVLLVGNSLDGVLVKDVLGESINWVVVLVGGITDEWVWDSSIVGVHEVSVLVNGSWELMHISVPSLPVALLLEDLVGLKEHAVVKFILVSLLHHGCCRSQSYNGNNVFHFYI
jgi:hypothetical protein